MALDGRHGPGVDGDASGASLLARICRAAVDSLPVSGAAVSVMTAAGHRGVVVATDHVARSLEDTQFTAGAGPGCEAFGSGQVVIVSSLDALEPLWSAFREAAVEQGVQAVFAFPLHLGAAALGTLTAYHREPGALTGEDLARAVRLADTAAVALLDLIVGAADTGADTAADVPVAAAELYRAEIYQAAGMVMEQLRVSIEVATVRLRAHAYASGRPINDVAGDIVARKLQLEADNA